MGGVVLENLSNKKLSILAVSLLLILIVFFLIGGLIAPAPSNVMNMVTTKCHDITVDVKPKSWYIPRGPAGCDAVDDFDDPIIYQKHVDTRMIVFALWIPYPRDHKQLDMSRWFQNMLTVLQMDIEHRPTNPILENATMKMEVRLGYRNKNDNETDWKELISTSINRPLHCEINGTKNGEQYKCDLVSFFELGSVHYDYYLINLRLPVYPQKPTNQGLGTIKDIWIITIFQNGGFTKVWFALKTTMFPVVLTILVWFWRRIKLLSREPNLLERTLLALGIVLSIMNCPVEWFTIWFDLPWMTIVTDVRQGAFYATLMSFWMIFAGEHIMDSIPKNSLSRYKIHLSLVVFGCLCLFIFEMCEKGMQLANPFYTIWVTETGAHLALAFIILAGMAACTYFLFLSYMIFKVFRNISAKKTALPRMSNIRRKFYMGLIFRFKFLMVLTLLCAALTTIFFIISQVSEGQWKWGDEGISLEYSSAFLTGVYGMWNVYVIGLLSLYAPSHKQYTNADINNSDGSQEEEVQLTQIPTENSALSSYVTKEAED
ncbi:hypothetical protein SNE40_011241 [Patella caerulea]|uniref:Protein wntless n=2 Tax=Patella caerulea TaxID=87958 RepID=A0AAN8PLB1_PATCE